MVENVCFSVHSAGIPRRGGAVTICHCCHGTGVLPTREERIARRVAEMVEGLQETRHYVSWDMQRTNTEGCAFLLGLTPKTISNGGGRGPIACHRAGGRGAPMYALREIAEYEAASP